MDSFLLFIKTFCVWCLEVLLGVVLLVLAFTLAPLILGAIVTIGFFAAPVGLVFLLVDGIRGDN